MRDLSIPEGEPFWQREFYPGVFDADVDLPEAKVEKAGGGKIKKGISRRDVLKGLGGLGTAGAAGVFGAGKAGVKKGSLEAIEAALDAPAAVVPRTISKRWFEPHELNTILERLGRYYDYLSGELASKDPDVDPYPRSTGNEIDTIDRIRNLEMDEPFDVQDEAYLRRWLEDEADELDDMARAGLGGPESAEVQSIKGDSNILEEVLDDWDEFKFRQEQFPDAEMDPGVRDLEDIVLNPHSTRNPPMVIPRKPKKAGGGKIRKISKELQALRDRQRNPMLKNLSDFEKRVLGDYEAYSERNVAAMETARDPGNENITAVRVIDEDGTEHSFLYDNYADDPMDAIEEVEFESWPPTAGEDKPLGNFAGGGSVKRALEKLKARRFELEESSDPDIDLIAREMMKDPDTKQLGRRLMDNERRVADPTMSFEEAQKYYERISRLFDEAMEKLKED